MNQLPTIKLKPSVHHDKQVVQLEFERNAELQNELRTKTNMRWSKTMNCWYLPYSEKVKSELFEICKGKAWINYEELQLREHTIKESTENNSETLQPLSIEFENKINQFKHWLRSKRYSESTIGTYTDALRTFLRYFSDKALSEISNNDLIRFNNEYILKNKFSSSYQNQVVNGVKLFFRTIENKKIDPELIQRPKRAKVLPNVLSKEEVKLILNAQKNIKHKAMLSLIYSCGLRRGELLNLKLKDIDSKRGLVIIRQGKGKKDRITPLSEKVLVLLREYFMAYKPKEWLFEGQNGNGAYDERSLASVLKQALEKSKINKPVTLHWLRHSYATHLLENGTDLRYIQEILGHSSSKTTEIYTHVSNKSIQKVISPFDSL